VKNLFLNYEYFNLLFDLIIDVRFIRSISYIGEAFEAEAEKLSEHQSGIHDVRHYLLIL